LTCLVDGNIAWAPMKRNSLFPLFLLAFTAPVLTRADSVKVPVPGSGVTQDGPDTRLVPQPDFLDVSMSTWAPSQMRPYSILPTVSGFSTSFPGISVSYLSVIQKNSFGTFSYRLGLEFRKETRSAPGFTNESLYLLTARIGAEWKPNLVQTQYFSPFVGFSLLPTLATASDTTSTYDNGISSVVLPVEFDLGTEIPLSSSLYAIRLTFAGQLVLGSVLGSNVVGTGVIGGVRIPF
jgi:hypothetical protein